MATFAEQYERVVLAAKLPQRVADGVLAAVEAVDLQLEPIPGGEEVAVTSAGEIGRVRVPGSTVQICTVEVGTAGWFVWREIFGLTLERSAPTFVANTEAGVSIASISGLTGTGSSIVTNATEVQGLAGEEARSGVAMIAAAGFGVEPSGGGTHAAVVPAAEVERRICQGSGDRVAMVAVTLGTAAWAVWLEVDGGGVEPARSEMAIVRRPSGYSGSVFDAGAMGEAGSAPEAIAFSPVTDAALDALVQSEEITLAGVAGSVWPIVVRGDGSPAMQINGGAWVSEAIAIPGDTVRMRLGSSASGLTETVATLYAPNRSAEFSVTTAEASFGPAEISGLAFWTDPDDAGSLTLSGSEITALANKGDAGGNAVISGQPQLATINGKGVVSTPSSTTALFGISAAVFAAAASGNTLTAVWFVRLNATNSFTAVIDSQNRQLAIFYNPSTGTFTYRGIGTTQGSQANSVAAAGNYDLIVAVKVTASGAGGASVRFNGGSGISLAAGTTWSGDNIVCGANPSTGGVHNNGQYGDLCLYDSALADSDIEKLEGYLAHKYGVTSLLPSGHPYKSVAP